MVFYAKWVFTGVAMVASGILLLVVLSAQPGFRDSAFDVVFSHTLALGVIASFAFGVFLPCGLAVVNTLAGRPTFDRTFVDRLFGHIRRAKPSADAPAAVETDDPAFPPHAAFYAKWILRGVAMAVSGILLSIALSSVPDFPAGTFHRLVLAAMAVWTTAAIAGGVALPLGLMAANALTGRATFDRSRADRLIGTIRRQP
ncbi:MAG: hypothetical protein AAF919_06255 [Pseudomonadota bacterium]